MARVKSNRDRGASKKRTASSNARVVKPSKSTMRSGAVVRKNTKKDFKGRVTIKLNLAQTGAGEQSSGQSPPHFHLFPRLPIEVRLKIWSLMAPSPRILVQNKRLEWNPRFTQFDSEPTPAVMHVCRESRNEYIYREDDAANNAERKSHALYSPMFPDQHRKMIFFSFQVDALYLTSFRVAEPVVRNNLRTIVMGPHIHSSSSLTHTLPWYRRTFLSSRTWYTHRINGQDENSMWQWNDDPLPANKHTLVISRRVYKYAKASTGRDINYNFHNLVKFPALEKLVVLISWAEVMPVDLTTHIIWKTLNVVKKKQPSFNLPEVEFRAAD